MPRCRRLIEDWLYVRWNGNNLDEVVQIATQAGWEPQALTMRKDGNKNVLTVAFSEDQTIHSVSRDQYIVFDSIDGPTHFTSLGFTKHFKVEET